MTRQFVQCFLSRSRVRFLCASISIAASAAAIPFAASAATRYDDDGALADALEVQRWLLNRGRYNPEADADGFGISNAGYPDYDVCEDSQAPNDFGAGPAAWEPWKARKGPVAPNARLSNALQNHCQDMAETGLFQHASPSATYYPLGSSPSTRIALEGYPNQISGYMENLATRARGSTGGYPSYGGLPQEFYGDLFVDTGIASRGHRKALLNADAREVGLGWTRIQSVDGGFFWTRDYTGQDFGRRVGIHFFTGTVFHDQNGDGEYSEGEGIGGIEVRLFSGATEAAWFDASGPSGGFAVPIADLPDLSPVVVRLVNTTGSDQTLSIPLGTTTLGELTIPAGQGRDIAMFSQPATDENVGFRDAVPIMNTFIGVTGAVAQIAFNALAGVTYDVEAITGLSTGTWTVIDTIIASTETEVCVDSLQAPHRIYRVRMLRD